MSLKRIILKKTQQISYNQKEEFHRIKIHGMEYMQTYSRGKPVSILKCLVLPDERKDLRGTRVRFWPDKEGLYYMIMLF